MALANFEALLATIRQMRDRIYAMSVADATQQLPDFAAEAARVCEGAGITDSNVQRFAVDILDEAVRRRYMA